MGEFLPSGIPRHPDFARLLADPEFRGKLRRKIRRLVRPRADEVEDLEQQVIVKWLKAIERYDPGRVPLEPFLLTVADRYLQNQLRDRTARKRDPAAAVPLLVDAPAADGPSADMALDASAFAASLPDPLRVLARAIQSDAVDRYLADEGICRGTYRYRLMKIRALAEEWGLADYSENRAGGLCASEGASG